MFSSQELRSSQISLAQISDGVEATVDELRDYTVDNDNPVPLFYQTGYLTICGYDKEYAIPYQADGRGLYKVGVVFSTEKRNVVEWKVEG